MNCLLPIKNDGLHLILLYSLHLHDLFFDLNIWPQTHTHTHKITTLQYKNGFTFFLCNFKQ